MRAQEKFFEGANHFVERNQTTLEVGEAVAKFWLWKTILTSRAGMFIAMLILAGLYFGFSAGVTSENTSAHLAIYAVLILAGVVLVAAVLAILWKIVAAILKGVCIFIGIVLTLLPGDFGADLADNFGRMVSPLVKI